MSLQAVFGQKAEYGYRQQIGTFDVSAIPMPGADVQTASQIFTHALNNTLNPEDGGVISQFTNQNFTEGLHHSNVDTQVGQNVGQNAQAAENAQAGIQNTEQAARDFTGQTEQLQSQVAAGLQDAGREVGVGDSRVAGSFNPDRSDIATTGLAMAGAKFGTPTVQAVSNMVSTATTIGQGVSDVKAAAGLTKLPAAQEAQIASILLSKMTPQVNSETGQVERPEIEVAMPQPVLEHLQSLLGDPATQAGAVNAIKSIMIPAEEQPEFREIVAAQVGLENDYSNYVAIEDVNETLQVEIGSDATLDQIIEPDSAQAFWDEMNTNSGEISAFGVETLVDLEAPLVANDITVNLVELNTVHQVRAALEDARDERSAADYNLEAQLADQAREMTLSSGAMGGMA